MKLATQLTTTASEPGLQTFKLKLVFANKKIKKVFLIK